MDGFKDVDVKEPAIHQRWSTIREEEAEASAMKAYPKCGLPLALGMRSDMSRRMLPSGKDTERNASEFDAGYYRGLLEKACDEVVFVFKNAQLFWPLPVKIG